MRVAIMKKVQATLLLSRGKKKLQVSWSNSKRKINYKTIRKLFILNLNANLPFGEVKNIFYIFI